MALTRVILRRVLRYLVLGPLEVVNGSEVVALPAGRQRLLLAVLLAHPNRTLSTDQLIDALWDDAPPASAVSSLHNLVSAVRGRLPDGVLVTRDGGYALQVADGELDAHRFEALVADGHAALAANDADRAAKLLARALELWRGPALGELSASPALAPEAARLEDARVGALEGRIDADLACGRHAAVLPELDRLVREHPLRERLVGQRMLALYRAGRQADALAAYRATRERLTEELGLRPSPALRQLEQAMLDHDPQLGLPDTARRVSTRPSRRRALAVVSVAAVLAVIAIAVVTVGFDGDTAPATASAPSDAIAVLDPDTGRVVERFAVGRTPNAVAVGAGAVWAVNADDPSISRIDLRTREVQTVATGTVPLDLAAAPDGAWLVSSTGLAREAGRQYPVPETLTRLDPASGAPVSEQVLRPRNGVGGSLPPQLVSVADGAVWAIGRMGSLTRVEVTSGRSRTLPGLEAERVAAGDGQVWIIAEDGPGKPNLLELDPASGEVTARVRIPSHSLGSLTVGSGSVWVTDAFAGGVWQVDANGRRPPAIIAVDQGVDGIAASDDAVWTSDTVTGTVARIDLATNAVSSYDVGGTPRAVAIGEDRVWVSVTGSQAGLAAGGPVSDAARVQPVESPNCGRAPTGPDGRADLLIASDQPLAGEFRAAAEASNAAAAFVLREHGFRAGHFRVALQTCNDGLAQTGGPDEPKCRANGLAFANEPSVIGVVGPLHSVCAESMLPELNAAPGGPVSMVAGLNTRVNLVRPDPGDPPGVLRRLYPTGQRGYARLSPSDDYEAAAGALFARRLNPGGVFFLQDDLFGDSWDGFFRTAARRAGLPLLGDLTLHRPVRDEAALARRIRASGARVVYMHGTNYTDLRALRSALGPDVDIILSIVSFPLSSVFERFGQAARGVYMMVSTPRPAGRESPAARRFRLAFGATRPGGEVPALAFYAAAATETLLDAIARSDGTRESVARALATVRLEDSALGPLALDRRGELLRNTVSAVRLEHGRQPFDPQGIAGGEVAALITPPARLVRTGRSPRSQR